MHPGFALIFLLILFSCSSTKDQKHAALPHMVVRPKSNSYDFLSELRDDHMVNVNDNHYKITFPDSLKKGNLAWGNIYFTGNEKSTTGNSVFFLVREVNSPTPTIIFDTNGNADFHDEQPRVITVGNPFEMSFNHKSGKGKFPLLLTFFNQPEDSVRFIYYSYLTKSLQHPLPSYYYFRDQRMNCRLVNLPDGNVVSLFDYDCNGLYDDERDRIYAGNLVIDSEKNANALRYISADEGGRLFFASNTYQFGEVDPEGNWVSLKALNRVGETREKITSFNYETDQGRKNFKQGNVPYTLFYFWGTWCQGCHFSAPYVDSLKKVYKDKIDIVDLNHGDYPESKSRFIKKYQLSFTGHSIDQKNLDKLFVSGFPSYLLIDREGFVLSRTIDFRLMDSITGVPSRQVK